MTQPSPSIEQRDDTAIINQALGWIGAGHEVSLATVVSTWGASPRPVGSHLLIRDDNLFEGSVSGGCIEGEVVTEALAAIRNDTVATLDFGVSDEDAWNVGLACGGQVQVFVQKISVDLHGVLAELQEARAAKKAVALLIDLETGVASLHVRGPETSEELNRRFVREQSGIMEAEAGGRTFVRIFNPPLRMLIVGAVHIAQALIKMAAETGYEVIVIDPRDTWGTDDRFPGVTIDRRWPSTAMADLAPDERTAVVTLCHDPKLDDPALLVALESRAFYIGSLGSRRTHANRVDRLMAAGISEATISRIHAPVGLDIGARTPAEIALSVIAQVTEALRKVA